MPTPVSTVRQCLTEEAARALDDAVAVARRRCHAQTTSLHALSALLSLPSSLLRDACSRSLSFSYSPKLQFRALDLCVGVSLDRLPTSKSSTTSAGDNSSDDPPPVSNSLMAAIKRSQANQRRQPELYQIVHNSASAISSVSLIKVELKNFVISILDDPIVSRVLAEAGFRSTDIKLMIIRPPAPPLPSPARYFRSSGGAGGRCPPLFFGNLTDSGFPVGRNIPFLSSARGSIDGGNCNGDEYCRRIGEVLVRTSGRNPLLIGVCATDALGRFKECVKKGNGECLLRSKIVGLDLICLEKEIAEFVFDGGSKDALDSMVKELSSTLEKHTGPGMVANFGDLNVLIEDTGRSGDAVRCLVSKLSSLVELYKKKMWLIGASSSYETYRKFLTRFPTIERDWDLQPLPITSSRYSVGGLYSKSSLIGSFIPLGGFFSTPSDFKSPLDINNQPFTRCSVCNEKYDQELFVLLRGESLVSVADQWPSSLPSWLRMADSRRGNAIGETKDDKAESNAKILGLQKKWDGICQQLHQVPKIRRDVVTPANPCSMGSEFFAGNQGSVNLYPSDRLSSSSGSSVPAKVQICISQGQNLKAPVAFLYDSIHSQTKPASKISESFSHEVDGTFSTRSSCNLNLPPDHKSSSSVNSVITDLGLGTIQPICPEMKKHDSQENREQLQLFSHTVPSEKPVNVKASEQVFPCSFPTGLDLGCQLRDQSDREEYYKLILKMLTEKVAWQLEACQNVSKIVSCHRGENAHYQASNVRRDAWIAFTGPDKVGKKRMAEALAELMFGSRQNLIAVDLSAHERMSKPHLMFDAQLPDDPGVKSGRKTIVDYIAEELSKKPCSVVFLENVDKADDLLAQRSLSRAIQTGKFPDSHGREISIANAIILVTCGTTKENHAGSSLNGFVEFTEETILQAHCWQMQIEIKPFEGETASMGKTEITIVPTSKRKQYETDAQSTHKKPKLFFDLNMPVEEDTGELTQLENKDESDTISDNSRAWLQYFLEQVNNKVTFKPFNFHALSEKLLNKMSLSIQNKTQFRTRLEIAQEVMAQILAAAWCSDQEGAVDDWIEEVLGGSFVEAQRRLCLDHQSLLKLVSCPDMPLGKEAPSIRLPRMINFG